MVDKELLEILACPETKEPVSLVAESMVEKINQAIAAGSLVNRGNNKIEEKIDAGLLREDGKYLYPIREDIPIMLIEEAISVDQLN